MYWVSISGTFEHNLIWIHAVPDQESIDPFHPLEYTEHSIQDSNKTITSWALSLKNNFRTQPKLYLSIN